MPARVLTVVSLAGPRIQMLPTRRGRGLYIKRTRARVQSAPPARRVAAHFLQAMLRRLRGVRAPRPRRHPLAPLPRLETVPAHAPPSTTRVATPPARRAVAHFLQAMLRRPLAPLPRLETVPAQAPPVPRPTPQHRARLLCTVLSMHWWAPAAHSRYCSRAPPSTTTLARSS